MTRMIGIGHQNFEELVTKNLFYIDKTFFIKEWWENNDVVTLITRPRRFGKTLNLSMVEYFFSTQYTGKEALFQNLSIWRNEKYRTLLGTYPVIFISFADVKETTFHNTRQKICQLITDLYNRFDFLLDSGLLNSKEKTLYQSISANMEDSWHPDL